LVVGTEQSLALSKFSIILTTELYQKKIVDFLDAHFMPTEVVSQYLELLWKGVKIYQRKDRSVGKSKIPT